MTEYEFRHEARRRGYRLARREPAKPPPADFAERLIAIAEQRQREIAEHPAEPRLDDVNLGGQ